jgi:hypothetical protein
MFGELTHIDGRTGESAFLAGKGLALAEPPRSKVIVQPDNRFTIQTYPLAANSPCGFYQMFRHYRTNPPQLISRGFYDDEPRASGITARLRLRGIEFISWAVKSISAPENSYVQFSPRVIFASTSTRACNDFIAQCDPDLVETRDFFCVPVSVLAACLLRSIEVVVMRPCKADLDRAMGAIAILKQFNPDVYCVSVGEIAVKRADAHADTMDELMLLLQGRVLKDSTFS